MQINFGGPIWGDLINLVWSPMTFLTKGFVFHVKYVQLIFLFRFALLRVQFYKQEPQYYRVKKNKYLKHYLFQNSVCGS